LKLRSHGGESDKKLNRIPLWSAMLPRTWRGAIVELGIKPPSVEQPRLFSDLIRVPAIMKPSRHQSRRNLPRLSRSQGTRRVNDWEVFGKLVEKPVESTRACSAMETRHEEPQLANRQSDAARAEKRGPGKNPGTMPVV